MVIKGHRIEKKIKIEEFLEMVGNYSKDKIECTHHTFFRLSKKQRKLFKCEDIREYLLGKKPVSVGIQYNKNYAIFYTYKGNKAIRMMLDIAPQKIGVVTFYIIDKKQIPVIK